jgi:hypothetical protein
MEVIAGPAIERHAAQPYLAIREIAPFRGMLSVRDRLWAELFAWLEARQVDSSGSVFMRLNVIDMKGSMDIEAGIVTSRLLEGDDRVGAGQFPAGDYATLTYRDHSIRANRLLIDWTAEQGLAFDRSSDPAGDRFACRYELNLTDPRVDNRRTKWLVQLNFLIRPEQGPSARGARHG